MVPLSTFVTITDGIGPDQVDRYQGFVSALVLGDPVPSVSSGQAIQIVEEVADRVLPPGYEVNWTAQALQEKRSASSAIPAFTMAMMMVFLILAALYEKWSLPFGVILTVPFALLGALLAVFFRGMPNDIYFQIGLVTLIGLAAKNAILIVAFAVKARDEGRDDLDGVCAGRGASGDCGGGRGCGPTFHGHGRVWRDVIRHLCGDALYPALL
jgi:HAE1 family hydrophobic/amphiphilic exporter-1/multidrug efflux pump